MKQENYGSITRRRLLGTTAATIGALSLPKLVMSAKDESITLTAKTAEANLTDNSNTSTQIWGYNGQVPGPTLRVRQHERLRVNLVNELDQPTTVHWHGIRIDNAMDGTPDLSQPPIEPGANFLYDFSVPDAGTFWYHTHFKSYEQLARGLYGILIVEEPDDGMDRFDREINFVVDDWLLDDNGRIHEASLGAMMQRSHAGRYGNWLTVNSSSDPRIPVQPGERLRVRVINTCNARILRLVFPTPTGWIIAIDGQPVPPHLLAEELVLAPGQRADVVIDIDGSEGDESVVQVMDREQAVDIAWFVRQSPLRPKTRDDEPAPLPSNGIPAITSVASATHVPLVMNGGAMSSMTSAIYKGQEMDIRSLVGEGMVWAMNGKVSITNEPLFDVKRGTTVVIDFDNDNPWPHVMHIHGHHFVSLTPTGAVDPASAWRDSILMYRNEKQSVAFVADNPGDWMLHCHMAEHQTSGMMSWFRVS